MYTVIWYQLFISTTNNLQIELFDPINETLIGTRYCHSRFSESGSDDNEGETSHSLDLQKRNLTNRCSQRSYSGHFLKWGGRIQSVYSKPHFRVDLWFFFHLLWWKKIFYELSSLVLMLKSYYSLKIFHFGPSSSKFYRSLADFTSTSCVLTGCSKKVVWLQFSKWGGREKAHYIFCWLVGWLVFRHINLCRLFNTKSIFIQVALFWTIQFSMSTQFNCQKHFYFKLFNLFKQF